MRLIWYGDGFSSLEVGGDRSSPPTVGAMVFFLGGEEILIQAAVVVGLQFLVCGGDGWRWRKVRTLALTQIF